MDIPKLEINKTIICKTIREEYSNLTGSMSDNDIMADIVTVLLARKIAKKAYKKLYKALDNI